MAPNAVSYLPWATPCFQLFTRPASALRASGGTPLCSKTSLAAVLEKDMKHLVRST